MWVLVSRLHPKDVISQVYPNYTKADKAEGLVVASEGPKPIRREEKVVVVFRHPPKHQQTQEFDCWALHRFVHVTEEGDESGLFSLTDSTCENNSEEAQGTQQDPNNTVITENLPENQENVPAEIVQLMSTENAMISSDDTDLIRNICPDMVDDDNQPLPENVPTEAETTTTANQPQIFSSWEHSGSCFRYLEGGRKNKARLNFNTDVNPTIEQLFEMFFFKPFIVEVIIPETNKRLKAEKHRPVTYGEFLRWLGLWFLMATITGPDRSDFWSLGEVDCFVGAPMRLGHLMSRKRFEAILKALSYTSRQRPAFRDRFWEVCQMLDAWNTNMMEQFTPSWVNCLDESMSTWTNKYSCPGWMFVPRKPWPFGNEYHTVCCSLSGILWQMELVEGKDSPSQIVPKFSKEGKTVGLLLRVLEPIFAKGMVVILNSGFCVLRGIIELKKRGVYASALIKKRKYWPKHIKGAEIKAHFDGKDVGDCDSWKVNVNLATTYFCGQNQKGQIEFRKLLAKTLIFNTCYDEEQDKTPDKKRKQRDFGHSLITLPKGKKFLGTRIVSGKCEYPQHKCVACSKRVRTYCLCSPGIYRCAECFGYHLACTENNLSTPS